MVSPLVPFTPTLLTISCQEFIHYIRCLNLLIRIKQWSLVVALCNLVIFTSKRTCIFCQMIGWLIFLFPFISLSGSVLFFFPGVKMHIQIQYWDMLIVYALLMEAPTLMVRRLPWQEHLIILGRSLNLSR